MTDHDAIAALQATWHDLCAALQDAETSFRDPARGTFDARVTAEGYRSLTHVLRYGFEIYLESDPARPRFLPLASPTARILGDNTDTEYCIALIDGRRDYRIRGRRGDECYLSFIVHGGPDPAHHLSQRTVSSANHLQLDTDDDGNFEIALSRTPPRSGNWMALTDDAAIVISREYYFDKAAARRPTYTIEPVDGPGPLPVFDPPTVTDRLAAVTRFLQTTVATQPQSPVEANVVQPPFRFTSDMPSWGTPDNVYCRCRYELGPDDALVVDGNASGCLYWGIQLWNPFMQSLDSDRGPVSFNSRTARLGADGSFRVVVAHTDPGVPNWLPTTGLTSGVVFCRWLVPEREPATPTARVVPVGSLA